MPLLFSSRPFWIVVAGLVLIVFSFLTFGRTSRDVLQFSSTSYSPGSNLRKSVYNETLGFQKIFVINLPIRTDHKDSMTLAAHFTGLNVEFVDGVTEVEDKTLPPHDFQFPRPVLGAWRSHMNIARIIVEQNISSALILEDDADWDIRIKSQMQEFAKASRNLLQPLSDNSGRYLDTTNPRLSSDQSSHDLSLAESVVEPTDCAYGDLSRWDILWLGHCGTRFPRPQDVTIPLGRVAYRDESVPESQHIGIQFGNNELVSQYPNHTRVVHRAAGNVCTLGYAISLPGARRMLFEFSMKKLTSAMDLMLNGLCEGLDGRKMRNCLSIQPQLFQHHRAVGNKNTISDIAPHPDEWNPVAFTRNIRWSTRINFPKLLDGQSDYTDTFPDGVAPVDYGF